METVFKKRGKEGEICQEEFMRRRYLSFFFPWISTTFFKFVPFDKSRPVNILP